MKIVSIVGTRPEIIKSSRIFAKFDQFFEHTLIHTGQNYDYELNEMFFDTLGVRKPDIYLNIDNSCATKAISEVIDKTANALSEIKPDGFYLLGDTNSGLSAISAKKLKIPIYHMEAGNRCFSDIVPEEVNRKIIDHISDVNMTYTEFARDNLLREGLHPKNVIKVGSTMGEVLNFYDNKISASDILDKLCLVYNKFMVLSLHREENVDNDLRLKTIMKSVEGLLKYFNMPIVFSVHPRTKKRIEKLGIKVEDKYNQLVSMPPLSLFDYVKLQKHSYCVISDSGSVQEESAICGFSAVTIRNEHERPESTEAGAIVKSGIELKQMIDSIKIATSCLTLAFANNYPSDYFNQDVSGKIVRIINGGI